jgi:uncharacterized protein (DUF2461 family)
MEQVINQDDLKRAIQQLIVDQPDYFKNIIKEIVTENLELLTDKQERELRVDKMIDKHFDRFDDVFKALA